MKARTCRVVDEGKLSLRDTSPCGHEDGADFVDTSSRRVAAISTEEKATLAS